jgi:group I intron endonuclease
MFIYKITNKVNNKVYIGQSVRPIKKRFNRHINDAIRNKLDTHFARAIRKYGKDNFICEVIDTAKNQNDLTLKEQYWIQYYDSVKMGYNETDAISKCGGNTYASKTEEELLEISERIRKSKVGKLNPNSKSVKCYNIETKEELFFETVKECQEYFGEKHHRFITNRVLNKTISLYKNVWRIAYADGEYGEYTIGVKRKRTE